PKAAIGIEALHRLNHPDITFGDEFRERQAVTAIAHGDLRDEAEMAGDQSMSRVGVAMLPPALGEHVLLFRLQHWEFADLLEIPRQIPFRRDAGQGVGGCRCHPLPRLRGPRALRPGMPQCNIILDQGRRLVQFRYVPKGGSSLRYPPASRWKTERIRPLRDA